VLGDHRSGAVFHSANADVLAAASRLLPTNRCSTHELTTVGRLPTKWLWAPAPKRRRQNAP
jgi:hypothetical protein